MSPLAQAGGPQGCTVQTMQLGGHCLQLLGRSGGPSCQGWGVASCNEKRGCDMPVHFGENHNNGMPNPRVGG